MDRVLRIFEQIAFALASLTLIFMVLATTIDASLRYFLRSPLRGIAELTGDYALPIVIFLSLATCYRMGGNVRVTLLVGNLRGALLGAINVFVQLVVVAVLGVMTYATWLQAARAVSTNSYVSGAISYPLWPSYAAVFAGLLLTTLIAALDLRKARSGRSGLFLDVSEEI